MVQVSLEHLLWPQPGSRKQWLGGHRGGHGAQLQLGLEAVPTCHQEEAKALSHSGTMAGSLARKLAFADPWPRQRGRNEASLEGPHRSDPGCWSSPSVSTSLCSPVQLPREEAGVCVWGGWLSLSQVPPSSLVGVDKPRWTLASELTVHFQPPLGPYPASSLLPFPWPHSGLSQEPTGGISSQWRWPGLLAAMLLPSDHSSSYLSSKVQHYKLLLLTGKPAPQLLPACPSSCT